MLFNNSGERTTQGISKMTFVFFIIFFFVSGYLVNNLMSFTINKLELFIGDSEADSAHATNINLIPHDDSILPVVILGGGSAGFTAAVYTSQAGYIPTVFVGKNPGGAISKTSDVRNWPGIKAISGAALANQWKDQAISNGADLQQREVIEVDFSQWPFLIKSKDFATGEIGICKALTCIISVGATPNYLGIPGEKTYWGRGVTNCAICDSYLAKNSTAVIIGGGDSAMAEAKLLSNIAKEIIILVRGNSLRAKSVFKKAVSELGHVKILYETKALEIVGDDNGITGVKVQTANETPYVINTKGIFLAVGSKPNVEIFKNQLALQPNGCLKLFQGQSTSVPGVFAAGDVTDAIYRQAVIAAGDGCRASLQAMHFLGKCGVNANMFRDGKITKIDLLPEKANFPKKSEPIDNNSEDNKAVEIVEETKELSPLPVQANTSSVFEIETESEFNDILEKAKNDNKIVLLDFYGVWCQPCKIISEILQNIAVEEKEKVIICKINVDTASSLTSSFKVRGVPSLLFFDKEGRELNRMIGGRERQEIIDAINTCLK